MANYNVARLGTANMYDNTIATLSKKQKELADQANHLSAGKKVLRPSDDPVAAAQAERARTRLQRVETDQRALDAQRASIEYGESSLREVVKAVQDFRELVVQAGNGSYSQTERNALVQQMEGLRTQILGYANRKDSNGLPLFRGLDSQEQIIQGQYSYAGQSGQQANGEYGIASSLDGAQAFMSAATGNGVLAVQLGREVTPATTPPTYNANKGGAWSSVGTIVDPSAATALISPKNVSITFTVVKDPLTNADITTFSAVDELGSPVMGAGSPPAPMTNLPYKPGDPIRVAGTDFVISGAPADGDGFTILPSTRTDLFSVLDSAIATARNGSNMDGSTKTGDLTHGLGRSLAEIDTAMNRVSTVRSYAGSLLKQVDSITETLKDRDLQLETQRADAEDIDPIKALSELESMKVSVSTALQSYASIQKLSLFNFIN